MRNIVDVKSDKLASAQRAGKADQYEGSITYIDEPDAEWRDQCVDYLCAGSSHLAGGNAFPATDACPNVLHDGVGCRCLEAGDLMAVERSSCSRTPPRA